MRFYLPPEDWQDAAVSLRDEEAHHCRDVMRCTVGEQITIFDGCGRQANAEITNLAKKEVSMRLLDVTKTRPLPAQITLGQAIPKGKNMDLIIQKATELGATRIVPLLSTNTVVRLNDKEKIRKQQKWQRVAIEACKQCGQNWLPQIGLPVSPAEFVQNSTDEMKIVAAIDPQSRPLKEIMHRWDQQEQTRPSCASLLIGPEGDLTTEEVETALASEFQPLSLGPIILRSETAAIYTVSVIVYELMGR